MGRCLPLRATATRSAASRRASIIVIRSCSAQCGEREAEADRLRGTEGRASEGFLALVVDVQADALVVVEHAQGASAEDVLPLGAGDRRRALQIYDAGGGHAPVGPEPVLAVEADLMDGQSRRRGLVEVVKGVGPERPDGGGGGHFGAPHLAGLAVEPDRKSTR